ncbi:MAG: transketolase [Armatimonadota bacterium]|nr:transketolase [Armatimonadota bacterium]
MAAWVERARDLARQFRADAIRMTAAAGSGHPTSALSAAELMAVLLLRHLRYDFANRDHPNNDRLIFSKGHATPLLYPLLAAAGAIPPQELLTYRRWGSRLEGHPTPVLPWVEVATGSLGQGLAIGVGMALAGKYLDKLPYRVWVLHGDSEMAEGAVWEAFEHAAYYRLDNLIAILDVNRLGQRGETMVGWNTAVYAARARAFGWRAIEVDGHDVEAVDRAYTQAVEGAGSGQPVVVIARTVKGKGVSFVEDRNGWHGKALSREEAARALEELGEVERLQVAVTAPEDLRPALRPDPRPLELPRYQVGGSVATREAYGDALRALGDARPDVVALDGEVNNSTYAERFARAHPERYFEMFIAEQQMVAAAVGLQSRGWTPFVSTFAAFLTRAYDFIRMAAISRANLKLCGSHAGVSIGEDGPSQMGLEDLAMMRAVHGSTVLYPCDANQTAALVAEMADRPGIVYLRTTRMKTPVIYPPAERFPVGGSRVLRSSDSDQVTLAGAGVTTHEALRAADLLAQRGIRARVVDCYSVKPIDAATLRQAARSSGGRVVVAEDHWPEGGLGDAVVEVLTDPEVTRDGFVPQVVRLGVRAMPGSGTPAEQLAAAGIDAAHIAAAAAALVESPIANTLPA